MARNCRFLAILLSTLFDYKGMKPNYKGMKGGFEGIKRFCY
jgi:hypothetical protein